MTTANGINQYLHSGSPELDSFGDFTPDLDYNDGDNFDFENADLGGDLIGALPGSYDVNDHDGHEKRKHLDDEEDDDDDEGNQAKRQETQDGERVAKKPGRKPLTNEPTTKRKAQNRAAQRAFRERKEKHLKDLETKVADLEKSQEADKHENGMLKAQVERLQVELRDYKKRLSLNNASGAGSHTPPFMPQQRRTNANINASTSNNAAFSFDFPKFGSLPQTQNWAQNPVPTRQDTVSSYGTRSPSAGLNQSQSPNGAPRHDSSASVSSLAQTNDLLDYTAMTNSFAVPLTGYSTNDNMHGFATAMLPQIDGNDPLGDLFSPSLLRATSANVNNYFPAATGTAAPTVETGTGGESTAGFDRAFRFNSTPSTSASPSASSASQWNAQATNSSCGTSPEPLHESPAQKEKTTETYNDRSTANKPQNPSTYNSTPASFDKTDFTVPISETFDPVLFGGYRDNAADNLYSATDFSTGLFDDVYGGSLPYDVASPSNLFGILQSPQPISNPSPIASVQKATQKMVATPKPSDAFLANLDKTCNGGDDDYGLTAAPSATASSGKMISCNNIWTQLQSNPDFQDGKFDLDGLCSELRAKAKCSESGVMVPQDHVDAALRRLGDRSNKQPDPKLNNLMFEQASWDKAYKKLGDRSA